MTWINYWLKYANYDEIREEAKRRGMFPSPLQPAIIYREISSSDIGNILPKKYNLNGQEYWTRGYIRDTKYKLTSIEEIKRFLTWNQSDKDNYVSDYYDCDNFSLQLTADCQRWSPGIAFGIMDIPAHSKNICVTNDLKIWEIEPQSDVIKPLESQVTLYLI